MSQNKDLLLRLSSLHAQLLKRVNGSLSVHGISLSEIAVLDLLDQAPNQTLRRIDLADQTGLTASGITRLLNPMEKIGLVAKEEHPRDARVSLVKLTDAGARILSEANETLAASAERLFAPLGDDGKATLSDLLNRLPGGVR
ncbi:MarR family transcriptional regulator [bacterium]|nr:MarR family transcriptional regulator [bacterium]